MSSFVVSSAAFAQTSPAKTQENGYVEPFKLFDNVYYIGDRWASSYLIVTPDGLVVIDTLLPEYAPWLIDNIKAVGQRPEQVKYVLITHGHSDHIGGAFSIQTLSDAPVLMGKQDATLVQTLAAQGKLQLPKITDYPSEPLRIGGIQFEFIHSPGHTPGSYSIRFNVTSKGVERSALIFGGMGTNFEGVVNARQYLASVARIRSIHQRHPFAVNLANHPHMSEFSGKFKPTEPDAGDSDKTAGQSYSVTDLLTELQGRGERKLRAELAQERHERR